MIAAKWASRLTGRIDPPHHTPLSAGEEQRDIVFIVYHAIIMCRIESRPYQLYYAEDEVLARFALTSDPAFSDLHAELKTAYDNRTE